MDNNTAIFAETLKNAWNYKQIPSWPPGRNDFDDGARKF